MTNFLIWLYLCCGLSCGASFWKHTDSRRSIKISGAVAVAVIGPLLFPSFVFSHAIEFMRKARRDGLMVPRPNGETP